MRATRRKTLVIGSRGNRLALWQSEWVKKELGMRFPAMEVRIQIVETTGDPRLDSPPSPIGGKDLFTKELEQALLEHRIDCALHSLKDLPTHLPEGLLLGAVTRRGDVHDVFIARAGHDCRRIEDLPPGATIATGSLRQRSQLLHWRPDVKIVELRGNLEMGLAKLDSSEWSGIVLDRAGVERLGFKERISQVIPLERMLPAVGQGALALEIRREDERAFPELLSIASEATFVATSGERAFLRCLEGECQIPCGAYGRIQQNEFHMECFVGSLDGKTIIRGKIHGESGRAQELGGNLARVLSESGGRAIMDMIRTGRPS